MGILRLHLLWIQLGGVESVSRHVRGPCISEGGCCRLGGYPILDRTGREVFEDFSST